MTGHQEIAKAVMEKYGALSEQASATAKLFKKAALFNEVVVQLELVQKLYNCALEQINEEVVIPCPRCKAAWNITTYTACSKCGLSDDPTGVLARAKEVKT